MCEGFWRVRGGIPYILWKALVYIHVFMFFSTSCFLLNVRFTHYQFNYCIYMTKLRQIKYCFSFNDSSRKQYWSKEDFKITIYITTTQSIIWINWNKPNYYSLYYQSMLWLKLFILHNYFTFLITENYKMIFKDNVVCKHVFPESIEWYTKVYKQ